MSEITSNFCESTDFAGCYLSQYGRFNVAEHETVLPFLSEKILLVCVVSGSNTFKLGNTIISTDPGMVFACFPHQCVNGTIKEMQDGEACWAELSGDNAEQILLRAGLSATKPWMLPNGTETARLFEELTDPNREHGTLRAQGLLLEMLDSLLQETPRPCHPKVSNLPLYYVNKSIRFIETKYAQDISVEDVAAYCGLNRSYLGKLFRDSTGMTTQEYLIRHRMKIACSYLAEAAAPISVIARSVGYPNQLHFSRAFHKVFDIPPREWQKRNRKKVD